MSEETTHKAAEFWEVKCRELLSLVEVIKSDVLVNERILALNVGKRDQVLAVTTQRAVDGLGPSMYAAGAVHVIKTDVEEGIVMEVNALVVRDRKRLQALVREVLGPEEGKH